MVITIHLIAIAIPVIGILIKLKERYEKVKPIETNFVYTWNDVWHFPEKEVIVEKEVEVVKKVEVEKKVKVRTMMSPFKVGIFRLFNYDDHTWILFINDWAVGAATFLDRGSVALDWFRVLTQSTNKDDRDIDSILRKNDLDQNNGTIFLDNHLCFMEELLTKDLEFFRERYRRERDNGVYYGEYWPASAGFSITASELLQKLKES